MMTAQLDVQFAVTEQGLPNKEQFQLWVNTALNAYDKQFSLCVRVASLEESQSLNSQYRGKDYPTNVLSFTFDMPDCIEQDTLELGDLVVCADVVAREAQEQNKQLFDHWAHMIVHGTLHLLGFDHINDDEAEEMEQLERDILAQLNIADPYLETN